MRTTVTLDSHLLEDLLGATKARSQSQAIRLAVETYVQQQKIAALDRFRGKVRLDPGVRRWRHAPR